MGILGSGSRWWKPSTWGEGIKEGTSGKGSFFFSIGSPWGFNRETKQDIIEEGFLGNDAVYSVVHKIALNGSMLPIIPKKLVGKEYENIDEGKLPKTYFTPNNFQSRQEFLYAAITYFALTGDLFILKDRESVGFKDTTRLVLLPPQRVTIKRDDQDDFLSPISYYELNKGGRQIRYSPEDIMHLKWFDPSDQGLLSGYGLSPLQAGGYLVDANNQLTVAENSILKNRGANYLISGNSELGLKQSDKDTLDEALRNRLGGAQNFNKSLYLASPAKVDQLGMSSSDLQLIGTYSNQLRRICTMFSLPAELFNAEKSGQFNTRKEALKSMYNEGVIPVVQMILAAEDRAIWSEYVDGFYQEIDKSKVEALNPDKVEQQRGFTEMYKAGAISREKFLELNGYEDEGQVFAQQTGLSNGTTKA
jgi:HK97 family phage portal protein